MSYDWLTYECAWCAKEFLPDHVMHKYCSTKCRLAGQKVERELWRQQSIFEKARNFLARQEVKLLCDAIDKELCHEHHTL
jgi:hypothetical protein